MKLYITSSKFPDLSNPIDRYFVSLSSSIIPSTRWFNKTHRIFSSDNLCLNADGTKTISGPMFSLYHKTGKKTITQMGDCHNIINLRRISPRSFDTKIAPCSIILIWDFIGAYAMRHYLSTRFDAVRLFSV
jgi:hypothetical protein